MEFELKDEYITLAQLLKACDVVYVVDRPRNI